MAAQPTAEFSGEPFTLRNIAWREIFPWLLLVRCVRLAMSFPVLMLATIAVWVSPAGWWVAARIFQPADVTAVMVPGTATSAMVPEARQPSAPGFPGGPRIPGPWGSLAPPAMLDSGPVGPASETPWSATVNLASRQVRSVFFRLSGPFRALFALRLTARQAAYYSFGSLVSLAIWSLCAGAITRIVGLYLARDLKLGTVEAVRHGARHFLSYFSAPLYPFVGVAILTIPLAMLGLIMRLDSGAVLGAVVWPIALIGGLVVAVLLLGLLFGWPLMWPAISLEEQGDAFEALSRSYSYTFQRPFHYLAYALFALLLGSLGTILVHWFVDGLVYLTVWGASWGAGAERMVELTTPLAPDVSSTLRSAHKVLGFWTNLLRSVGEAYPFAFFWSAATGIYLLLRKDADDTEIDEVYVDESEARYTPQLLENLSSDAPPASPTSSRSSPAGE